MEEESRAIAMLGTEEDKSARKILIEHNLRLVVYIAKKFDNTGVGVGDLISIGTIGLIKAINTFDPGKNIKLATYASRCIENEILMYLRRPGTGSREKTSCESSWASVRPGADDHKNEIWYRYAGWGREDTERSGRYAGDFSVLHLQAGEENYAAAAKGDGKIFIVTF